MHPADFTYMLQNLAYTHIDWYW